MTTQELQDELLNLLYELQNEDPNHRSRNMYAGRFRGGEIGDKELHTAIYNLYKQGYIVFEDRLYRKSTALPYPLVDSTFHLPN